MAELGSIVKTPEGSELILTINGWVPSTPDLEAAGAMGAIGGLAEGLGSVATLGMYEPSAESQAINPISTQTPGAVEVGLAATGLGGLLYGGLKRGARAGLSNRLADRVKSQVEEGSQLVRRPSDIAGGGATATGAGLKRLEGGLETIPVANLPLLAQKAVNQRRVNMSAAQALGVSDDAIRSARTGLDEGILDEALEGFQRGFRGVEDQLTGNMQSANILPVIDQAIESKFITGKLATRLQQGTPDGKDVMAVRSKLTQVMQSNEQHLVKEQAAEIIEQIDDIIEATLGAEGKLAYRDLRSRYRIWANLRQGRSLSPDGQVNVRSLGGRLARNYGDRYRTGQRIEGVPDDVNDFIRIVKEGEGLDVGTPDSGTASRTILGLMGVGGAGALID